MSERDGTHRSYEDSALHGASARPEPARPADEPEYRPRTSRTTKITAWIVAIAMLAVIAIPAIAMLHQSLGPLGAIVFLLMVAAVAAFMRSGLRTSDERGDD